MLLQHVVQRVGVGAHSSNLVSGRTINNVAANSALLAPPLGAAPEYMGSDNGGDEDVEIELLMSRGYTREQATEVYFNRRNRTSQLNATLSQPSSDAMNRVYFH